MPQREYYIQQARSCFDMATMTRDAAARDRWIARANEYLLLADTLGDDHKPAAPPSDQTQQPQEMQQQQQRAEPEDGTS